jgi:large subunit ribosomal protein L35
MALKKYKLKTNSSCKKRFKITGTGQIMASCAFKRHGMRKRSNKFIRNSRGMKVVAEGMAKVIRKVIPYGL